MFNYKKELDKCEHIVKKYIKTLKKNSIHDKDINKLNTFILNNITLVHIKNCKFNENVYNSLTRYIEEKNYKIKEENIIKFITDYSLKEEYYFSYSEFNDFTNIIYFILIKKLSNIITIEQPQLIKYTVRKEIIINNILNSLSCLFMYNVDKIICKSSKSELILLEFDEYKNLDYSTRKQYRNIICKEARHNKMSEYQFTKELATKAKKSGKYLCDYLFKRINYKMLFKIEFILSIILSLLISLCAYKFIISNICICFIFLLFINWLFILKILFKLFPKDYILKNKVGNILNNDKTMVMKYCILNNAEDVIKEYNDLEKYALGNNLNNIHYTLFVDCTDCDHQIEPFDEEILEQGFNECNRLNKKYSKQIFYFVYRKRVKYGKIWYGYNRKNGAVEQFSKLLLDRFVGDEDYNYFTGYSTFSDKYKYVLVIDDLNYNFDIKELICTLKHPYNRPISKNNKFEYGYSMISLDGKNIYGQSSFSNNILYDLEMYDKFLLGRMPSNILFSNYIRTFSISNTKINIYDYESIIKNNFHLFKWSLNKNSHFNFTSKMCYLFNIFQMIENLLSIILLVFMILNKYSFLWIIYFLIVVPNFIDLPTHVYFDIKVIIKLLFNKNYRNNILEKKYKDSKYYVNYIFSIIIVVLSLVFKLNIIFSIILCCLFVLNKLFNYVIDNIRRRRFL